MGHEDLVAIHVTRGLTAGMRRLEHGGPTLSPRAYSTTVAEPDTEDLAEADRDLVAAYRREPPDPELLRSAAGRAARTSPPW